MEYFFLDLKKVLEAQKDILNHLLDTARNHNRALRQLDTVLLQSVLRREEELMAGLRKIDREREKAAGTLAERLGLPEDAHLSMFIEKAPPAIGEEMNRLLEEMGQTAGELAGLNDINRALTRQAARANEIVLKSLGSTQARVYTPDGRTRDESQSISLINKKI